MAKTFDQYMAESGQQSTLDQLRASGQYDAALANYNQTGNYSSSPSVSSTNVNTNIPRSNNNVSSSNLYYGSAPGKTFDQYMAESGQQSTLDQLRATGQYEAALARYNQGGAVGSSASGISGMGFNGLTTSSASLNLPDLYKSLYKENGIEEIQASLKAKEEAYNAAVSKINDNPFLSEANRTGRVQKLSTDYQNAVAAEQNDIAMKKADIETQLSLATQQFDIESNQAKQALDQFNMLLSSGALNNASGEDIAAITRATGISSNMIQSAINSQKEKDNNVTLTTIDDGTNIYSVAIDKNGNVVNKQVLSASKPSSSGGSSGKVSGLSATQYRNETATALKILNQVDSEFQTISGKLVNKDDADYNTKYSADRYLSSAEADLALQKIIDAIGDASIAEEIFVKAWQDGGYQLWGE